MKQAWLSLTRVGFLLTTLLLTSFTWSLAWSHAQAQPMAANVPVRTAGASFVGTPTITVSMRDFLNKDVESKLQSGLPQTIVTRIYVYDQHGGNPITITALSCRVVYDLWEGVYRIERQSDQADRTLNAKNVDGVVQQCLELIKLPVGDAKSLAAERGKRVYLGVIVELNPMSQDTVQRIRRWLARPSGNQLEGSAFFGSFVSIFVTRTLGVAEKTLSFRTPYLDVPP